ncbi:MAG TPA: hypothetical protein VJX92_04100 [Methylomirabilota bacterium]|nr:hypothetical protein [Methylomirabilota bacterium]
MALRVLSGMLFIDNGPKNGRATIVFSPFALGAHPRTVSLRKARVIGADGTFTSPPAAIVPARQFKILEVSPNTDYRLRINDTVTTNAITISWAGSGPIFHEEIPFMIVGEVGDRLLVPEISRPRRPVRRRPRPSRRPAARRKKARRKKSRR